MLAAAPRAARHQEFAMLLDAQNSRLVLVDYQARLMPAIDDHESVLTQARKLGQIAQLVGVETVGTEQNPKGLGPNDDSIRALCSQTFSKSHFAAFREAQPAAWLQTSSKTDLVLAGCEAHVCLLQTALSALALGLAVTVVEDACGSRKARDRQAALARLRAAGVRLVTFEMAAFEWLKCSDHPRFKDALQLLR